MSGRKLFAILPRVGLVAFLVLSSLAVAQTYTVLYSFGSGTDGANPVGFGTTCCIGATYNGGLYGYGTVFSMDVDGTETIIHNFSGPSTGAEGDGAFPMDAPLLGYGRLYYGTTFSGGPAGGTLYQIDSTGGTYEILFYFGQTVGYCQPGGCGPEASPYVIKNSSGDIFAYGTAGECETTGGCVYGIDLSSPTPSETVFWTAGDDGGPFYSRTTLGPAGLYFTVDGGEPNYDGVYQLAWTGTVTALHIFTGSPDGANPGYGVIEGASDDLYGTTSGGGAYGNGTIFKVSTAGVESVLYSFTGGSDGGSPQSLARDPSNNLYGTTASGGANGYGTLFELSSSGVFSVLHTFCSSAGCSDGATPSGHLLFDVTIICGTTWGGGAYGKGTAYCWSIN
jgi:uncharacterized repeat protein (TIGR03803 family)